jgi:Cu/Zn superoxide dismutase
MKIFDAIQEITPCPRTKSKGCQCERLESISETEQTINAICTLEHADDNVEAVIKFIQKPGKPTIIKGIVKGLTPGKHGFHIHEFGDLSDGCASAGGHYNPEGVDHGSLQQGHVGDLGNIIADKLGTARFQLKAKRVELSDVVGRAVVIHADEDDLGLGGDAESLKTGNAGDRVGCGVIRLKEVVEEAYSRSVSDKHFDRNQLPQINRNDVEESDFDFNEGKISLSKLKPVQSQRVDGYDKKAEDVFLNDKDKPFIIDKEGYIINGHHRYDAANILGIKRVKAIKINADIEDVMNYFNHKTSDKEVMPEHYFKKLLEKKLSKVLEAPILRPERSYEPDANDAYNIATTDSTPKYDYDHEVDYRPGKSLGRIPNIQSETEVIKMPNGELYLFYSKTMTKHTKPEQKTMWQKFVKAMLQNPKNQTGPSKEKNIVGFLKLKPFEDGYRVAGVGMDPEIRGQGKAIKLYLAFSAWKGIPIYSDYTQTPSAKTMWNSIIGRYPKRVVAYDQKNRQDIPLAKAGQIYQNQPDGFDSFTDRQAKDVLGNTKLLKLLPESIEAIQDTSALMKGIEADLKQREKDLKKLPKKSIYDENFADGKKKGKSRPGRVKKAGASCNGSVTSLRKKAKNSSGEKSKMYHWCANMKSGKKKK